MYTTMRLSGVAVATVLLISILAAVSDQTVSAQTVSAQTVLAQTVPGDTRNIQPDKKKAAGPQLPNRFFAMNFDWYDPTVASHEVQADLLKKLGYQGYQYLGTMEGLPEVLGIMEAKGLRVETAALRGAYNISVDPDAKYKPALKDMIRELKGHGTLVVIGFSSRKYKYSSPEGDALAVAAARELADYARQFGLRVAIYPHANQWCERVEDALRIARKADRANLGICFNLYHWLKADRGRDLDRLVAATKRHLFLVTINGTSPEGSMETLDRGGYDVYSFLKPFIASGYKGPIGLQCCGIRGDARDNLRRSMAAWQTLSARLASERTSTTPGGSRSAN